MRKLIIIFCLLSTVAVKCQTAKDTTITDSTGLLTIADGNQLITLLQEIPAKYANPIIDRLNRLYMARIEERKSKKQQKGKQ